MNERIKHLAASHFPRDCNGDILTTPESITDFAELIVRCCAEVGYDSVEDGDDIDDIMRRVHNNILEHFGVKA